MTRWLRFWRIMPVLMVLSLVLTGCGDQYLSALDPQGPVAESQLFLILFSLAIMIIVFVVVMIIYVYVLVRYRERPGQTDIPKQVEGNHKLEIIWTVIPIIFLIILAVPTVSTIFSLADQTDAEEGIKVRVTAYQYWWKFEYPDLGIVTAQELVIPEDQWVFFEVKADSDDVLHSFWVPSLGGKVDALTSNVNLLKLKADNPGLYHGKCAELCGPAHALMNFKVKVVEQAEYDTWVAAMTEFNPETTTAQAGREIFVQNCIGCHATDAATNSLFPNLTGFAERSKIAGILDNHFENGKNDNLFNWIKDPNKMKPGNEMPPFGDKLSDAEIQALVEYMSTLTLE